MFGIIVEREISAGSENVRMILFSTRKDAEAYIAEQYTLIGKSYDLASVVVLKEELPSRKADKPTASKVGKAASDSA